MWKDRGLLIGSHACDFDVQHYAAWMGVAEGSVALTSAGANILATST